MWGEARGCGSDFSSSDRILFRWLLLSALGWAHCSGVGLFLSLGLLFTPPLHFFKKKLNLIPAEILTVGTGIVSPRPGREAGAASCFGHRTETPPLFLRPERPFSRLPRAELGKAFLVWILSLPQPGKRF